MLAVKGTRDKTMRYMYKGFAYHADSKQPGRRYVCALRTVKKVMCPVSAIVDENNMVHVRREPHLHGKSLSHIKDRARQDLKDEAEDFDQGPHQIVNKVYKRNKKAAKIMQRSAALQTIARERRKYFPKIPATLGEMAEILEGIPHVHREAYHGSFQSSDGTYGLVFTSDALLNALRNDPRELYVDGTFNSRPLTPKSCQLLIIHINKRDVGVAIAFVLCENRTTNFYKAFWSYLIKFVPTFPSETKFVVCDYEKALINATREMLPDVRIRGCWIHYIRACTRRWNKLNLPRTEAYNNVLSMVWAMALLPARKFPKALKAIRKEIRKTADDDINLIEFFDYLRRVWLRQADIVSCWNCSATTNNICEGYNRQLPGKLSGSRPPMTRFINKMKCIIEDCEQLSDELDSGVVLNKGRRETQLVRTAHLNHCCNALKRRKFTIHAFLRSIFGYCDMNGDVDGQLNLEHYSDLEDADDFTTSLADPAHLPREMLGSAARTSDNEWQSEDSSQSEHCSSDSNTEDNDDDQPDGQRNNKIINEDNVGDQSLQASCSRRCNPKRVIRPPLRYRPQIESSESETELNDRVVVKDKVRIPPPKKRKVMGRRNTSKGLTRILRRRRINKKKNKKSKAKVVSGEPTVSNKSGGVAATAEISDEEWEINCGNISESQERARNDDFPVISQQQDTNTNGIVTDCVSDDAGGSRDVHENSPAVYNIISDDTGNISSSSSSSIQVVTDKNQYDSDETLYDDE